MSRTALSPCGLNSNIPIYLESEDEGHSSGSKKRSTHICPDCNTSSRDQPIHCIVVTSPAPPAYSSITPPRRSSSSLSVPSLSLETSRCTSVPQLLPSAIDQLQPQRPRRTLHFDPEGRPQVRFRRNAFSPVSPLEESHLDWDRKAPHGLGIADVEIKPDPSPITPGTAEKRGQDKGDILEEPTNLAQRIEQKLWKYSRSGNVLKRWLLEIISWATSAACMAGIIIMLMVYHNRSIPKWPLGLTLNAYISVLAKIAGAALLLPVSECLGQLKWSRFQGSRKQKVWDFELFDNASRGPWGSFLLLLRVKWKSLAALGAAVWICSLPLDTFFQQIVDYPETWRIQEDQGAIPRALGYIPYLAGQEFRGDVGYDTLDLNMVAVLNHYFYDNGTLPVTFGKGVRADIPVSCPNSNCTWMDYETLGFCNQCADASDALEFKCQYANLDWVQIPGLDNETSEAVYPNGTACGWWLKGGSQILMTGHDVDTNTEHSGEILVSRSQPVYDLFTRIKIPGYPARLNNSRNPLAHTVIVSAGNVSNVFQNATPIAHECIISWCAQKINSYYSEGTYTENITNIVVNRTMADKSPWFTEVAWDNGNVVGTAYEYHENVTIQGKDQTFYLNNFTHYTTLALFDDIFPSSFVIANSTNIDDALLREKEYITVLPFLRHVTYNPWLYPNIVEHLDKMVQAMTNTLRSTSTQIEMITGPSYDLESLVSVRWVWITLPILMLGVTFVFLVGTIIKSSLEKDHVRILKNSAIATLIYGFPDEMQKKITETHGGDTPRAKAKEMKVKWDPSGWRFSSLTAASRKSVHVSSPLSPKTPKTPEVTIREKSPEAQTSSLPEGWSHVRKERKSGTRTPTPPQGWI